jgi:RNA polymerase sigma-70 factor (ECF subfamily)
VRSVGTGPDARERALLQAARGGDEGAYEALVGAHRAELEAHCYRMLGSLHDAEDALQEALLRAWRGIGRFESRSSTRTWLYRIATNACLDAVARRPRRVLPFDDVPAGEAAWLEPYPDARLDASALAAEPHARYEQRESLELAFVAALQHVPARSRAVLILREVLGFSAREVAATLDTTVASVNSLMQRARRIVDERLPAQSQQATLRELGDERVRELVQSYMAAMERGDVDAVVELLTGDATWVMPPHEAWFRGLAGVRGFLANEALQERWRHLPARANGQVAVGCYRLDPATGIYHAMVLDVLTLRGERIAAVTAFVTPALLASFGLPAEHAGRAR